MQETQSEPAPGPASRTKPDAGGNGPPALRVRPSTLIAAAALLALCLVVYLPGFFSIPPVDRDESRFAQASRQMFESVALPAAERNPAFHDGGLIIPKLQDRLRLNKPPLIYWLQAASAALFTAGNPHRDAIWMYRVPSLLAAIAAVLVTWRLGVSLFDSRTGWLAAALLAVCPVVAWEAHQARADMLLLACTTLAVWALWEVRRRFEASQRNRSGFLWPLIFWLATAAGIMTKGPITPMVAVLTAVALSILVRRWRWLLSLRPEIGAPALILAGAPWVWSVAQHVGLERLRDVVSAEVFGRSLSAREGHWGPPGYHLVLLPVLLWPGSLLTAAGLGLAWRTIRTRGEDAPAAPVAEAYRFCLAWIVPAWIVFELVTTKLPHYTLPLYPALSILSARAVLAASHGALNLRRLALVKFPWLLIGIGICIGLPVACWTLGVRPSWWIIPLGLLWLGGLAVWIGQLRRPWAADRGWLARQLAGLLAMTATAPLLFQALLPSTKRLWVSQRLMETLDRADPSISRDLAAVGYQEDSLVFLRRGRVDRLDTVSLDSWLRVHPRALVVAPVSLAAQRPDLTELAAVWGYDYAAGRRVDLSICEARP